jgi:hypothetical protein
MRKLSLTLLVCAAVLISAIRANAEVSGGIVLGSPSALTLKIDNTLILGVGGWGYGGMVVYGDHWIIHKPIPNTSIDLNWYLGFGGELGVWNNYRTYWHNHYYHDYHSDFFLGVRIPIGLQILFEQRWEAFFEVAPVMMVFPFGPSGNGGIGIRYTF